MAVAAPKKPSRPGKGVPELPSAGAADLAPMHTEKPSSGAKVPMNFVVEAEFRKDYRTAAAEFDVSMTDILKESFELWRKAKAEAK